MIRASDDFTGGGLAGIGTGSDEVRRIVLFDARSVLSHEDWRKVDSQWGAVILRAAFRRAMNRGIIVPLPLDPLAMIVTGALAEACLVVANSDDPASARAEALSVIELLLQGCAPPVRPALPAAVGSQLREPPCCLYLYSKGMPRISAKNQVTIPVAVLEAAGMHAGDQVVVDALEDGELRIRRGALTFESAFGALTGTYPPGYLDMLDEEDEQRCESSSTPMS